VRAALELVPVSTMDEVFAVALHKVIVPQRIGDHFVIEVDDDAPADARPARQPRSAKGARRRG